MLKETAINLSEIGEDLENWMTRLPEALKNVPIVYLAIPGSHDSGSCSITPSSTIAPDTSHTIQELGKVFGPIVRRLVYNWVVTQHANITDQLMEGVRPVTLDLFHAQCHVTTVTTNAPRPSRPPRYSRPSRYSRSAQKMVAP
ncbi:PI-PLC X domain-containing protein 3 isoform X1 [Anabrus simplex]|uniref:PI-PLC X domain-containing protein 3 isoform X1 n=1 Tax=Anabrus simplex TaxID=316456 RepID=UPI0034DD39DE